MAIELLAGTDLTVAKSEADSSATVSAAYNSGSTGSNRRLVVVVSYEDGGNVNTSLRKRVSGVTYNGSALTAAVQEFQAANNATSESIEIWTLDAPATGSNTLAVSFSNNTEDSTYIIAAAVYTGVSSVGATASAEAVDGASDTVTDLALTFTDAAGYAVIALALSTAGMGPIDSVSGWTVDHEDEQGDADGGGALVLGHYQTDAASAKTFTWSPGASTVSTRRWTGAAIELIPAAAGITVTVDDDTPTPTQAIVITKSGGDFAGTVSVFLDDNTGTPVDVSAAVTGSGATRTLLLGAGSIANYDDSNATWELIRWGQPITLTVTDDDGTGTDIITITYAPDDHFDTLGASGVYVTSPAGSGDDSFVHIVSGDGEGLPILADLQGSTVPTVARFGQFDVSANKWLAQIEHTFDVASVTLDGEYADAFTGVDGTLITAHTPDADVVGDGYTIEKDVSTAPAVSNAVDIQSNTVRINDANEGLVIDVGDTTPDFSFDWKLESGASGRQFVAQVRRLDDTEHIHVYVQQTGLIRVNERVASANIGVTGTNETTYSGGFLENTTYRFRIYVDGLQVSVYVDDVLQVQVQSTRAADAHATKVGLFAAGAGTFPVYFDNANAYSDYSAAAITMTVSDETVTPGQTITLTLVIA